MRELDRVETVGVVGAGTMGGGIAQVCATQGYDVVVRDIEQELVEKGFDAIDDSLDRLVNSEKLTREEADAARDRLTGTTDLADLADCDLVVEAAVENMDVKRDVFADLDDLCDEDVVLATNTSTLSVTTIAAATDRPDLVVGLHFMNPVPVMKGVEVVTGEKTSDDVTAFAHAFAEDLGKETWESDDKPGFVTNRILMPWINEGVRAFDEGVASKEDIDAGMKLGTNVPMGPLELADHIGLDICLHASETLHEELGDRYKPAYLLKRKVDAGDLGKKTGKGFYGYDEGEGVVIPPDAGSEEIDLRGLALAPGFIDIHSHADLSLLLNERAESRIRQGVTTEVVGQDGGSVGPWDDEAEDPATWLERSGRSVEEVGAEIFLPLDVRDAGQQDALFAEIERRWGGLDFVLHSIAFAPRDDLHGRVADVSRDGFGQAMDISCHSFIRMARYAEPLMEKAGGGSLMTMSYFGAVRVIENYGVMGPVKAALEATVRYLAAELGPKGIRVHAVSPGPIKTRAASGIQRFDDLLEKAAERAPEHRLVTIEEVGATTAFLATEGARGITGSVTYVDAGYNIIG